MSGIVNSVLAGFFGASAGVAAKYAFDQSKYSEICNSIAPSCDDPLLTLTQGVCILALILFNLLVIQYFNRALQTCETTLEASLITTAANILITVIIQVIILVKDLHISNLFSNHKKSSRFLLIRTFPKLRNFAGIEYMKKIEFKQIVSNLN